MMTALLWAVAALFVLLAICAWRIYVYRREVLLLHDQIQAFLNGEVSSPAFSVSDNQFAMFENAVIELETRLVQSRDNAKEQSERSRAFVQDVSHQFKTPISGLRLFCEVDESQHREQKLQLVGRMEELIQSLLKLEKLRSDGYQLEYAMCDLRELALDVRAQFLPLYPDKRIGVVGDASIRCDAQWMFEALANLIKNACEHTEVDGNISIHIEQDGSEVTILVEDDGGGVPPEALPKLFERFYRTSAKGVGLGLSISRTIVQRHHGSIRAANGERGLVITIYLPVLHDKLKKT